MNCEYCSKEHDGSFATGRFCNRSCANGRKLSEETRKKISEKLTKYPKKIITPRGPLKVLEKRVCLDCGRNYEYLHNQSAGHTKNFCNSCTVNKRKNKIKKLLVEYKGGKCQIPSCRYNRSMRALKFHHLNPDEKDFGVSGNHCHSLELLKKEVDKCILVCGNCHDEIHDGIITIDIKWLCIPTAEETV